MTEFGRLLREERLDRELLLGDFAKQLGISPPYLSQIETGKRPVPDGFSDKVAKLFGLSATDANKYERAAAAARTQFLISVDEDADIEDRSLAAQLAESFARLSPKAKAKIRKTLREDERG
ncbi:MAG: helix-turn-helix transcriptional regulator [Sphingomonas bacterium]|nr:helix-turn-helix transcriptional regulator [Sphingomonas bacterium]